MFLYLRDRGVNEMVTQMDLNRIIRRKSLWLLQHGAVWSCYITKSQTEETVRVDGLDMCQGRLDPHAKALECRQCAELNRAKNRLDLNSTRHQSRHDFALSRVAQMVELMSGRIDPLPNAIVNNLCLNGLRPLSCSV